MRIFTSITSDDFAGVPARAAELEARGYDGVTTQENRHEPFLPLALAASATTQLQLLTNVAIAFPRSPMVTASTAWDLQRLSGGRFHLGLGTQVRGHIVRRFSSTWTKPAAQMRDYVRALRAIFRTWQERVPLAFESEHYRFDLMPPNFDPGPPEVGPPKILVGAVGPVMLRLAATDCDGVLLHPFGTHTYLAERTVPALHEALHAAGRAHTDLAVIGSGFIATGADAGALDRAREWVRSRVGFYGSTPAYRPVLDHHGLGALGERLHALTRAGRWDDLAGAVDDDVLDLFCVAATHDRLAAAVDERYAGVVDGISVDANLPAAVVAELRSIRERADR